MIDDAPVTQHDTIGAHSAGPMPALADEAGESPPYGELGSGPPALDLLAAARQSPVALLVLDHDCRVREANPAAETLAGATLGGRRFCEVFRASPCAGQADASCMFARTFQGLDRRAHPRWTTLEVDHTPLPVLVKAAVTPGTPPGVTVTMIPSTLVDEADRRRREMIAAAVHDIRHPISVQSLAIELLASEDLPREAGAILAKLRRATSYLTTSVDELLNRMLFDLNIVSVQPRALELSPLLEQVAWHLEPILDRRRQRIRLDVPTGVQVLADPAALEHIVVNLVINAHKYSVDHDEIVITARARTRPTAIEITVRDHGPGIPEHERRRVFDRFFRGAEAERHRGAGLGLAIVRSLVTQQGGTVGVHAARGGGALFRVRLPLPSSPLP